MFKSKTFKIVAVIIVIGIIGAGIYAYREFNRGTRDIESATPDFTTDAASFIAEFEKADSSSHKKYVDKVIQFEGKVYNTEVTDSNCTVIFDQGGSFIIAAQFLKKYVAEAKTLKKDQAIKIKGLYTGFLAKDEMFMIPGTIQIGQCSIIK